MSGGRRPEVPHAHVHLIPRETGDVPTRGEACVASSREGRLLVAEVVGRRAVRTRFAGVPSAEAQVRFLRDPQRILDEGSFVATYKSALIHALATSRRAG